MVTHNLNIHDDGFYTKIQKIENECNTGEEFNLNVKGLNRLEVDYKVLTSINLCVCCGVSPISEGFSIRLKKINLLVDLYNNVGTVRDLTIPETYKKIWDDINQPIQTKKANEHNLPEERRNKCFDILPKRGYYLASLVEVMGASKVVEMGTAEGWQFYTFAESLRERSGHVWSADIRDVRSQTYVQKYDKLSSFVRGTSDDLSRHLTDNKISDVDLFYVDASHDKGAVIRDVVNLQKYQSDSPVWVFDDYDVRFGCHYDIGKICEMRKNYKIYSVGETASGNPTHQVMVFGKM